MTFSSRRPKIADFAVVRGHTVHLPSIPAGSTIIDAGAHKFEFSNCMVQKTGCRAVAIEPNNSLEGVCIPGVQQVSAALWHEGGEQTLFVNSNPESSAVGTALDGTTESRRVTSLCLRDVLERAESRVSLLKLDIEGAEYGVISGSTHWDLKSIPQVTIEFHRSGHGYTYPDAMTACINRLSTIGFVLFKCSLRSYGDCLFLNRENFELSRSRVSYLRAILPVRRIQLRSSRGYAS